MSWRPETIIFELAFKKYADPWIRFQKSCILVNFMAYLRFDNDGIINHLCDVKDDGRIAGI